MQDPTTGLPSWQAMRLQVSAWRGQSCEMLMLDFVAYARVNHLCGHVVGDAVLRDCATALTRLLPAGAAITRPQGDAFLAVWPSSPEQLGGDQAAGAVFTTLLPDLQRAYPGVPLELTVRAVRREITPGLLTFELGWLKG